MRQKLKFFDISANLAHIKFKDDWNSVIARARNYGVEKFLFVGNCIVSSENSLKLSMKNPDYYCTIGLSPISALEPYKKKVEFDDYFVMIDKILNNAEKGKVLAIGECGLDYDRLFRVDEKLQMEAFIPHFALAKKYGLPMYFHDRNTGSNFINILKNNKNSFSKGVISTFTGSINDIKKYIELGLYIGVNGCSLKTKKDLDTIKELPLDRLVLGTHSPFCTIKKTYASREILKTNLKDIIRKNNGEGIHFQERNEPCSIIQILEIVAAVKNIPEREVAEAAWNNSLELFEIKNSSNYKQ